ncbi:MAG: hypothetical protein WCK90_03155 [archaeon]
MTYEQEAVAETLNSRVTIGAREGYDGQKEYSLEEVLEKVESINGELTGDLKPLNCIVSEGHLVGRSGDSTYREKVYCLDFKWSPRSETMGEANFLRMTKEYAFRMGKKMNQERVYIDFKGRTYVLKN